MNDKLLNELENYIMNDEKLLGVIFRLTKEGIKDPLELANKSGAANRGVIYNNLIIIRALLEGTLPKSSSISRYAARAAGRLMRNNPSISKELNSYLAELKVALTNNSESMNAIQLDQANLEKQSIELAKKASSIQNGIYVYSFPTYIHFGTIEDENVSWFKIGSTKNSVWQRIVEQNRQTSMPEDPKLLRIYHKEEMDIDELEKKFHSTLERVGHERSAASRTKAGKEWFATTLDAIDAIAELMGLTIEKYELSQEL